MAQIKKRKKLRKKKSFVPPRDHLLMKIIKKTRKYLKPQSLPNTELLMYDLAMFNMVTFRASSSQQCLDSSKVQSRRVTCNKGSVCMRKTDRHKCSDRRSMLIKKMLSHVITTPSACLPKLSTTSYQNIDAMLRACRRNASSSSTCNSCCSLHISDPGELMGRIFYHSYFEIKIFTQIQSSNENELKWK